MAVNFNKANEYKELCNAANGVIKNNNRGARHIFSKNKTSEVNLPEGWEVYKQE